MVLGTPGMEFHKFIVDPGTGQVLASQEMSQKECMKMQQMQHMMNSGMGGPSGSGMMMMGESSSGPMLKHDGGWN